MSINPEPIDEYYEKSEVISKVIEKNKGIRESITKTNGKCDIEKLMKSYPGIKWLLEKDEKVRYIAYKKKGILKIVMVMLILTDLLFLPGFIQDILKFQMTDTSYWFLFLITLMALISIQMKEILIFTNKAIIVSRKNKRSKIIKYSHIKNIEVKTINNNTIYSITHIGEKKNNININQSIYKGDLHLDILDEMSEKLEAYLSPEEKKKKGKAKLWNIFFILIMSVLAVLTINIIPEYKSLKLFGYPVSVIISLIIVSQTVFVLSIIMRNKKER